MICRLFQRRKKKPQHRRVRWGEFAGVFYYNPNIGDYVMQVPGATSLTGQLLFKDQNGQPITGPVGLLTSDVPGMAVALSSDGQSYNVVSPAAETTGDTTFSIKWQDHNGKIPTFEASFTVLAAVAPPPPLEAVSGEFGPASPGTTP